MVSETLRRWADPTWEQILRHPFVVEVYRGDLPLEKFRYYLLQDYNYLVNFAKALSLAAAKAPTVQLMKEALALAYGTVTGRWLTTRPSLKRSG